MRSFLILLVLFLPVAVPGQTFSGNYRAVFFNAFSSPNVIVAEFEVKPDNSLAGQMKIGDELKNFSGSVDKKGKFEAVIEQTDGETIKLRGKFDKENKISLVRRSQSGGGLKKSVSESSLEGTFSRFEKPRENVESTRTVPRPEIVDTGTNWLRIEHSNPLFGAEWKDFTAQISFGNAAKNTFNTSDPPDYFVLSVRSKTDGQQALRLNVLSYAPDKKSWKVEEFRTASYREARGEERISFLTGGTPSTDPVYRQGSLEIVKETETQIVFRLTGFRIKQFMKDGFVEISGYVYADKYKP